MLELDKTTRDKISNCDPETIANGLYNLSLDMDFEDYSDTKKEEISSLIDCLYQIKAIAQNPYNNDYYRTFLLCLDRITEKH